jgi:hypothetical protein
MNDDRPNIRQRIHNKITDFRYRLAVKIAPWVAIEAWDEE